MSPDTFNDQLRQVFLLILIIVIGALLITELKIFIPGLLGGITLYILSRDFFNRLSFKHNSKKGLTAILLILFYLIIIAIPVYLSIALLSPKIHAILDSQDKIILGIQQAADKFKSRTGISILTIDNIKAISLKVSSFIPTVINSTALLITNLLMMFFLFYFLLVNGKAIENYLGEIIPLKHKNIDLLARETKMMVKANALGIPIISIIQGIVASLGYWIFGLNDWGIWGFLTGVFAFFPLVGTMIIWVPLVGLLFAQGLTWQPIWLLIYSLFVTGNVDYVARLALMEKLGNVHPVVTVLGVIVGLNLFGFIGLIFGPLLISYFIVLVKIFINEFSHSNELPKV